MHFMGMTAMRLQDHMGHFYDVRWAPPPTSTQAHLQGHNTG